MQRYFLKNRGGRIVELVDEEEYEKWLRQGFIIPAQQEIDTHLKDIEMEYVALKTRAQREKDNAITDGIYFATISTGVKDGYGASGSKLLKELQSIDVKISTYYTGQKIAFLYHAPYTLSHLESPLKVIYTMFESSKIPDDWKEYLSLADTIIVPSKFCQGVFNKAGFESQIVPLGYDENIFKLIDRPIDPNRPFTFIHYDSFNVRKGFSEVFKAFVNEFGKDPKVKMILKTIRHPAPIPIPPSEYPNIEVVTGPMSDEELLQLLAKCDCMVFPSKGEGFGITPLEAMATGLPAIVPNAHGIAQYFNNAFMYEVAVEGECPALNRAYMGKDIGTMIQPSVLDLQKKMRYIYDHQEEAWAKGLASSYYVQRFSLKETAKGLKDILDSLATKQVKLKQPDKILPMTKV